MGIAERKEREKEYKRALILESAEKVILKKGLDHLNMDEVAEEAEVSKGSLYLYFKNKNDLVLGICHKASSMLNNDFARVLAKDIPGLKMVYELGNVFMNFVKERPEFFRAMKFLDNMNVTGEETESEYLNMCSQNRQEGFRVMVRAIQIGMQDGSIKTEYQPEELALLLWSTSHGVVSIAYMHEHNESFNLLDRIGISQEQMFQSYMKIIGNGIAKTDD
ncbi:MAG TPA: hypothetical protein DEQ34_08795 [Balneolaceae bacterium]|nr:hypothetical protein [Balneolaceae bacterium]|tara:strand:- start:33034 stop:33693 length:660 start_codon:yes stop_codon:yes gene_type:complete